MQVETQSYIVLSALDPAGRLWIALGCGAVRLMGEGLSLEIKAHGGTLLSAAMLADGTGLVTSGDDGRVVRVRESDGTLEVQTVLERRGRWLEPVALSPDGELLAVGDGKSVHVCSLKQEGLELEFRHERTVSGLAFDPKSRRLAAATYGGVALWYARVADQSPKWMKWAGSHIGVAWSPDERFLISSMQENQLHGWRLSDAKDMRMGGYPGKVHSLAFASKGRLMATSGAQGAVLWPFKGSQGPMGQEAIEIGPSETGLITRVAGAKAAPLIAAGRDDGEVWVTHLESGLPRVLVEASGSQVTSLAFGPDDRWLAFGTEDGRAGKVSVST